MSLLDIEDVEVHFGGLAALACVSFAIEAGTICGLIGPNGSGKTTLVNTITGVIEPSGGDVIFDGHSIRGIGASRVARLGIRRTFQNVEAFSRLTVLENVLVGSHHTVASGLIASGLRLPWARRSEADAVDEARRLLTLVGLDDARHVRASDLSFAAQRLLEVARALAGRPRLLLLDEPAAGLSRASVRDIAVLLRRLKAELGLTILLVEHVMALVMEVCEQVQVLDCGQLIFSGTPAAVQQDANVRRVYLGSAADATGRGGIVFARARHVRPNPRREAIDTDVLVVGGGAAALRAALASDAAGARTLILAKGPVGKSGNTPMAGGGYQSVQCAADSADLHLEDTLREGRGLGCAALVRRLVEDAPARLRELEALGAPLQRDATGCARLFAMPGSSQPRNVYFRGGGWGLIATLDRAVTVRPRIRLLEDAMLVRLTRDDEGVTGAIFVDLLTGQVAAIRARAVVLATGGYEALWSFTDASTDSTGEGLIAAYRVGAEVVDPEMVLFYPTVVCHPRALRGMAFYYEVALAEALGGGRLVNHRNEEFLEGFTVRDRLSRAIVEEVANGCGTPHGGVWLDLRSSPRGRDELGRLLQAWMPGEFKRLLRLGIDPRETPLEVYPGVHYCLGGIAIDRDGLTSVGRLFAAGEVAGNVHGVNRLAGNALAETQVFGAAAGHHAATLALAQASVPSPNGEVADVERELTRITGRRQHGVRPVEIKRRIQDAMWAHVGPVRSADTVRHVLADLEQFADEVRYSRTAPVAGYSYELQEALEVHAMVDLARIVTLAAAERKESRGHHYRPDHPTTAATPIHLRVHDAGGRCEITTAVE
jgi:succinate dehydrogenase/fumarate reductase flavoprotein subunit/ABC-type branched-subunit amino acid transport system ATPase component